ncbi:MAG TPA: RNA 3'-terminal phosphate cyclase [Polyangia bacterium]|jgi:RNA 3'-terminal phosphate cyclase (ATP)|nr:RNA 3'-terminal phosphate cyclase [Polyangia bacterium]
MLTIDGSLGEGGGQALRTSLSLSLVSGTPFRIENIRARRPRPGLMRQHLTAVQAAAAVGRATLRGAEIGSTTLEFTPATIACGEHRFAIGSAGSATLVLQTILPALLQGAAPSTIVVEGGTHNPLAPPFEFLERTYLPLLRRMGANVTCTLERHGFYPAGGGRVRLTVTPAGALAPLALVERGAAGSHRARAIFASIPFDIARRELATVRAQLGWDEASCQPVTVNDSAGPGNVVELELQFAAVTELVAAFGERGVAAETVAQRAVDEANEYLASGAPVGRHLADQLLLPCALAGGGVFVSLAPTPHFETQCEILSRFGRARVERTALANDTWRFDVRAVR